jgi:hypothetical protein
MKTATPTPTDPVSIVKTLDADAIQARLDALDAEASALRVLLRSARARQNAQRRARRPASTEEGRRDA